MRNGATLKYDKRNVTMKHMKSLKAASPLTSSSVFLHVLHALHGSNVLSGVIMALRVVKQPLHGPHFSVVQAWGPGQLAKWDVVIISFVTPDSRIHAPCSRGRRDRFDVRYLYRAGYALNNQLLFFHN